MNQKKAKPTGIPLGEIGADIETARLCQRWGEIASSPVVIELKAISTELARRGISCSLRLA